MKTRTTTIDHSLLVLNHYSLYTMLLYDRNKRKKSLNNNS